MHPIGYLFVPPPKLKGSLKKGFTYLFFQYFNNLIVIIFTSLQVFP